MATKKTTKPVAKKKAPVAKKEATKAVADKKVEAPVEAKVEAKTNATFDAWWDETGLELVRKGVSDKKLVITSLQAADNGKTYADFVESHMAEIVSMRKNPRGLSLLAFEF